MKFGQVWSLARTERSEPSEASRAKRGEWSEVRARRKTSPNFLKFGEAQATRIVYWEVYLGCRILLSAAEKYLFIIFIFAERIKYLI